MRNSVHDFDARYAHVFGTKRLPTDYLMNHIKYV
jgi:hypothetical protein